MDNFEEVKKFFSNGKEKLIAKGRHKKEVKDTLAKKVEVKPEKYKNTKYILLSITFQEADNKFIFGDLLVNIRLYALDDEFKFSSIDDKTRYIWFSKEYIDENGWSNDYLRRIAYAVNHNEMKFNVLSMPSYSNIEVL